MKAGKQHDPLQNAGGKSSMTTDVGRSPSGSGYSAEPEPCSTVSAVPVSIPNAVTLVCAWCRSPRIEAFYCGKRAKRCDCHHDYRSPVEKRRDAVLDQYGDDPAAYTPDVLAALAKDGLFDITSSFCPAGKLSMAETRAREASAIEAATAGETTQIGSTEGESAVGESRDAQTPTGDDA